MMAMPYGYNAPVSQTPYGYAQQVPMQSFAQAPMQPMMAMAPQPMMGRNAYMIQVDGEMAAKAWQMPPEVKPGPPPSWERGYPPETAYNWR